MGLSSPAGMGVGPPAGVGMGVPTAGMGIGYGPSSNGLSGSVLGPGLPPSAARSPGVSVSHQPGIAMGISPRMQQPSVNGIGPPHGAVSSNGLPSSGLGPLRPPGAKSPGATYGSLPVGAPRMQSPVPAGMVPSVSPHSGLGPGGMNPGPGPAGSTTAAQIQAYPHLAGAVGFASTSQASVYGSPSVGSSPYSAPVCSSYAASSLATSSVYLNGAPIQSAYTGMVSSPDSRSTLGGSSALMSPTSLHGPAQGVPTYHGSPGLSTYPNGVGAPNGYGLSGLRGPSALPPTGVGMAHYPGMPAIGMGSTPSYPTHAANAGMLRPNPIVATPAYGSVPYMRPV